jgi:16S rRNA (cytidine1402-2'-O)-methyltransferase
MAGIVYAIPTPLGGSAAETLPQSVLKTVRTLQYFVVENAKSARAFLKDAGSDPKAVQIEELTEKSNPRDLLRPLHEGRSAGLLSEAGCPAIADPGALLVEAAHRDGIRVVPLVGPSSIVLALMASGLEGQRFAFCGYLPRDTEGRKKKIAELESRSRRGRETQIFIETPYRSDVLLGALLETCAATTLLCVASDLSLASEEIRTKSVADWRRAARTIGKRPTVFLLLSVN